MTSYCQADDPIVARWCAPIRGLRAAAPTRETRVGAVHLFILHCEPSAEPLLPRFIKPFGWLTGGNGRSTARRPKAAIASVVPGRDKVCIMTRHDEQGEFTAKEAVSH